MFRARRCSHLAHRLQDPGERHQLFRRDGRRRSLAFERVLPSSVADGLFRRTQRSIELLAKCIITGAAQPPQPTSLRLLARKLNWGQCTTTTDLRTFVGNFSYRPTSASPVDWYDPTVEANWSSYHFSSGTPSAPPSPSVGTRTRLPRLCWMTVPESLTPVLNPRSIMHSYSGQGLPPVRRRLQRTRRRRIRRPQSMWPL